MKFSKIFIVLGLIATSLFSFSPAFADEIPANESPEQVTLQNIEEENNVQYDETHSIQERGGNWSTPPSFSNIECKDGKLAIGKCRAKWGDIANGLVNQIVSCSVNGMYGGRCKLPGKFY